MAEPLTPDMAVLDAARAFVHAWETGVDTTDEYAALLDAARAAAPHTTPGGEPEHPHIPQPSDICSVCGRGLVHVIPSLDAARAAAPAPELPRCEHGAIREPCIPCSEPTPEPTRPDDLRTWEFHHDGGGPCLDCASKDGAL